MHWFKVCSCLMCRGKQYCFFFSDCGSGILSWSDPHVLRPSYCAPSIVPHSDCCPWTDSLHIPIETGLLFIWIWVSHLNCIKFHKKEMFSICKIDIFFYPYYITFLCLQKLALTSPTSCCFSAGIVHSWTKATECVFFNRSCVMRFLFSFHCPFI
jgi:hypothetical protein